MTAERIGQILFEGTKECHDRLDMYRGFLDKAEVKTSYRMYTSAGDNFATLMTKINDFLSDEGITRWRDAILKIVTYFDIVEDTDVKKAVYQCKTDIVRKCFKDAAKYFAEQKNRSTISPSNNPLFINNISKSHYVWGLLNEQTKEAAVSMARALHPQIEALLQTQEKKENTVNLDYILDSIRSKCDYYFALSCDGNNFHAFALGKDMGEEGTTKKIEIDIFMALRGSGTLLMHNIMNTRDFFSKKKLKQDYQKIEFSLDSVPSAIEFYKGHNFQEVLDENEEPIMHGPLTLMNRIVTIDYNSTVSSGARDRDRPSSSNSSSSSSSSSRSRSNINPDAKHLM